MSHEQIPPPPPGAPERTGDAGGKGHRPRQRGRPGAMPVVSLIFLGCLLATLVLYVVPLVTALAQGVPDPEYHTSVTYTPQQGPPSPLVDSRPERIVQRFPADYLGVAETYPCVQDLSRYHDEKDPVLLAKPCHIARPVASYAVTLVTIRTHGFLTWSEAIVRYVIVYADGTQWTDEMHLAPERYQTLWPLSIHLDCWASLATLELFDNVVPDIPPGAAYAPPDAPEGALDLCKPATA